MNVAKACISALCICPPLNYFHCQDRAELMKRAKGKSMEVWKGHTLSAWWII